MDGLIDAEAPYPDGCGPDCKGCDPCVCGHPWSEHTDPRYQFGTGCLDVSGCLCVKFESLFKPHIVMPSPTEYDDDPFVSDSYLRATMTEGVHELRSFYNNPS